MFSALRNFEKKKSISLKLPIKKYSSVCSFYAVSKK